MLAVATFCGYQIVKESDFFNHKEVVLSASPNEKKNNGTVVGVTFNHGMVESDTDSAETVVENATTNWKNINGDVVGTISINGLDNEPIVSTPDNQNEYLYKDIRGNEDKNGTLFTAFDSEIGETKVSTVFGHSMKSGKMFGQLKKFKDIEYLKKNPTFQMTSENGNHLVKIVAVADVSCNYAKNNFNYQKSNLSEEGFDEFKHQVRNRSYFVIEDEFGYDDNYVVLSTCDYSFSDERLIVVGRIIDSTEEIQSENYQKNDTVLRAVEYYETFGKTAPSADVLADNYAENYGN